MRRKPIGFMMARAVKFSDLDYLARLAIQEENYRCMLIGSEMNDIRVWVYTDVFHYNDLHFSERMENGL